MHDKNLLCGIGRQSTSIVYIWLVPMICASTALISSYYFQTMDDHRAQSCSSNNDTVKDKGLTLSKLVLIQQSLLVCTILAAAMIIIKADKLSRAESAQLGLKELHGKNGPLQLESKTVSYNQ